MTTPGGREGLFSALKNIALTLLAMGQTRLELLGNEFEVQKLNALRLLLLAQAMIFCAAMGVVLAVVLMAMVFWEQRVLVFGAFTALFLLAGAGCYRALMRIVNTQEPAFAATLAELREDIRRLKAASGNATAPD